jgi:tripartite-type tricarboxylate transporter receptor subunit TctC
VQIFTRRSIVFGALTAPLAAHAQGNPQGNVSGSGPIWPPAVTKIVVPYPPAGSTDVIARLVQNGLQQRLGTSVIIENRAGASGSIGTAAVAKSPPDGSNWLIVFDNHAANPFVLPNLSYDTEKDLDPVLLIGTAPYVLSTGSQKPFKTLADVIAAAKAGRHRSAMPRSAAAASVISPWRCCRNRPASRSSTSPIVAAVPP